MRVGYVQMEPAFGEPSSNLERARKLLMRERAELWVLPELFNTGYVFASHDEVQELAEPVPDGPTTQGLVEAAQELKAHIVAGLAERAGSQAYNSAVAVGPRGLVTVYRKVHLFAEEKRWFAPGDTPFPVLDLRGAKVGVMVCFDHFFPEAARTLALQGAEIIAHPANLVMPGIAQRTMTVRALENRLFTVTANRVGAEERGGRALRFTGLSQIVSPVGTLLASSPEEDEDVKALDVDPTLAQDKRLNPWNDLLADRRPGFYSVKSWR
ncbi:MAG: nitrilase-related carbon-nitrogen hydrolase [Candidatus Bipolaricaulota bacterium]